MININDVVIHNILNTCGEVRSITDNYIITEKGDEWLIHDISLCCEITESEHKLLNSGDYCAEELFGVGGIKCCPKCISFKMKRESKND